MANVTIIPEDYDGLKKEYLVLRKELDTTNQELYGCKRQLKVAEALQRDYEGEIELLQSDDNAQKQVLEEKITQLEETVSNIRSKHNERIQTLESELSEKEKNTEDLKTEIEFLKRHNSVRTSTEDNNKLIEELVQLKQENETLVENEEELKLSLDILRKNNFGLEESLTECRKELSDLKESLSCKRDELFDANDLVQRLNDELYCVKTELDAYKRKPLSQESQGNSLFAEVDDRRVYLQKTITNMKSEYMSIKQERAKHLNLISHLRKENKTLCERWKADMEEKEDDQDMILKAYRDRIAILEILIEKYKKDLSSKPWVISTGNFDEIEFYQKMLNNKIKESEELRDQLAGRGLTQTILSTSLKDANREVRKWRLESTLRQCQLDLESDDSISEKFIEKLDEEIGNKRIELKQTKRGPHLACKKDDENETKTGIVQEVIKIKDETKTGVVQAVINVKDNTKMGVLQEVVNVKEEEFTKCSVEDVITINDSIEDIPIVDVRVVVKQENSSIVDEEINEESSDTLKENKENLVIIDKNLTEINKQPEDIAKEVGGEKQCRSEKLSENKENLNFVKEGDTEGNKNSAGKASRKVTFLDGTVSPKLTDRTALKLNCKRVAVPKAIYIPSE